MSNEAVGTRLAFAPPEAEIVRRPDGSVLVRTRQPLEPYAECLGDLLARWADRSPDAIFLAERPGPGEPWRRTTYGQAFAQAGAVAASLVARGLSAERPVVILSDNSTEHALLTLGAMLVGVPVAPVSPAYSLLSRDFQKLAAIVRLVEPGLIYAADVERYGPALRALDLTDTEVVTAVTARADLATTPFAALLAERPDGAVDKAREGVGPETVAKLLFTSGSTGEPKAVINTQRMLCSNQQALAQVWPFLSQGRPVLVDWLPWHHTFGGNHNFNLVLQHGGTLYIDAGRPVAGRIEETVANLAEVAPTIYFNVPRGFDMLLPFLERDAGLRATFFGRLQVLFYAGASLPQHLWDRLAQLSQEVLGYRVAMVSAWGATETAPLVTTVHFDIDRAGIVGLPAPGCEVKLVPNGAKWEMRVRGPNVTPGYWKRPDLTRAAFDDEGFYLTGDAGRLVDPDTPAKGIEFDGRLAEDFKLGSGAWVHVGALRVNAIAALAPVAQDVVIAGHDRDEIGLLVFPSLEGCRRLCPGLPVETGLAGLLQDERVRARVRDGLRKLAAEFPGSSMHATRAILMAEPPSIDAGEITDKGYVNQRAVLNRRAGLVDALYGSARADVVYWREGAAR